MRFTIPEVELQFRATRGGGPGGQHVNKTSTRVEVRWDITHSPSLEPDRRARAVAALGRRVHGDGTIRVVAAARRSQRQNREAAVKRLEALVNRALAVPKPRRPTRRPRTAEEVRLQDKKRHAEKKQRRRPPVDE